MPETSPNKPLARYAPIALIAAGLALALALRLHERLSLEALYAQGQALDAFVASNFLGALALSALIYAIVVTISLPGAGILTMACGFLFGTWFGGTVAWIGASIGATLIFLAARTAFGDALRARAGSWIERLAAGFRENAFNYLLVLRLTPIAPFFVVNVAPAVLNVGLRDYVLATVIGIVPATYVYAAVGAGLRKALEAGGQSADPAELARTLITSPAILGPIIGLIALAIVPVVVKTLRRKGAEPQAWKDYAVDLCVIGAGSAGLSAAAGAVQLGLSVVLFEAGEMGGDCLNFGCVPSKALIAAAHQAHAMRQAARFGIAPVEPSVDWLRVKAHIRAVIAAIEPNDSQERFEKLGVTVIRERARFVDARTVASDSARVRAGRIVIATGSRAAIPPVQGLQDVPYLTNETIFDGDQFPRRLIVLGGGPIGVELGQAFRRLGAQVTILEAARLLGNADAEAIEIVRAKLQAEGVVVYEGVKAQRIAASGADLSVSLDNGVAIEGSHLLIAAGRKPNLDDLGLDAAGVAFDRARIATSPTLRSTTNPHVWALGDAAGGGFTHTAGWHASVWVRNVLFKARTRADAQAMPAVVYCDPELAQIGLTEAQARAQFGAAVSVSRWEVHDNDRAQAQRDTEGFCKLILGKAGRILGATVVGDQAGELLAPIALAMSSKLGVRALTSPVLPYPTRAEIVKRAASAHYTPTLFSPGTRALIRILKHLP